jgi:CTP:molybdopterin cytidylyltransferase MocA/xanthine/CO dehydrogenase XdhC/CoxF family maturation factor
MRRTLLQDILAARRGGRMLVRVLDLDSGAEQLVDPASDTSTLGRLAAGMAAQDVGRTVALDGRRLFLSTYNTPWEIVIVGAVHIAQAVAALGMAAGYKIRVIDPREPYASQERFPGVTLVREWPDKALAEQPLTPRSALIVLAHDPKLDNAGLAMAVRSPAFYVGALGSARTQEQRLARLAQAGFTQTELSRVRGPVGLAIGARSPAEIAIAILAELVQARRTPKMPRIAGILLAAGSSSRMGRNKLTLPVRGKSLVRHAVDAALATSLNPVIVVTGHEADAVRDALAGAAVQFVHNERHAQGLSTSLCAGLAAVPPGCDGAMVLLGDMPAITPGLIGRVLAAFDPKAGRAICVARAADGRRGHPVLWGRQFFAEMQMLSGDQGARAIMAAHADRVTEVAADSGAPLIDIDTPQALQAYCG